LEVCTRSPWPVKISLVQGERMISCDVFWASDHSGNCIEIEHSRSIYQPLLALGCSAGFDPVLPLSSGRFGATKIAK
jgi:hypothetical protein